MMNVDEHALQMITTVKQLVPEEAELELADLTSALQRARQQGKRLPFADESIEFCHQLSQLLFADPEARKVPELAALAFYLRKSSIVALKEEYSAGTDAKARRVPRGLVFHIPPRNVETITIYSWLFSFLCGNSNVIRISQQASGQTAILCRVLREALKQSPPSVQNSTIVLAFGHEEELTQAIGNQSNMRVIWGGNVSINTIRAIPLPPGCHELTFFDRNSICAIRACKYEELSDSARDSLCEQFYNDVYMFDQQACSSPRMIAWIADSESEYEQAKLDFQQRLSAVIKKQEYSLAPAQVLEKFAFMFNAALEQPIATQRSEGNELSIMTLESLDAFTRNGSSEPFCGCGLLFEYCAKNLDELAPAVENACQTMTHFGFTAEELQSLADGLLGRGIDRMVPVGQALQFSRYWDGYDLIAEFSKIVFIEATK